MADEQDLWQLIAAPITAFNEAEAVNGARFVELLQEYAFVPQEPATEDAGRAAGATDGAPRPRRLRELAFEFERRNELGQIEGRAVRIPTFQFLPLGGLSIDRAKLNFALALHSEQPALGSVSPQGRDSAEAEAAPRSTPTTTTARIPRISGTLARRRGSASDPEGGGLADGNLEVEIELKQIDLPAGVLDFLQQTQGGLTINLPEARAEEREGGEDSTEEPWPPGRIFSLQMLGTSCTALMPGEAFFGVLRVRLNPALTKGRRVVLAAAPTPQGSLALLAPSGPVLLDEDQDLAFQVRVSQGVARYRPETPVGLRITATIEGQEESQSEVLKLPRETP